MSIPFWKRGEARIAASAVGISEQNFSDILHRRRNVSVRRAYALASATGVPVIEWLTNAISKHPAFYGKPARSL
jgi:transcriptional regulator with XRE-family HTH domain